MEIPNANINPFKLYKLSEAQVLAGISPGDLLRLAGAAMLNLCVLVPSGRRAFAVDPASVITWDQDALLARDAFAYKPDRERGVPDRIENVVAVVLDWSQCLKLLDYGVVRQTFFRTAYAIDGGRTLGVPASPLHTRPIRMPLFMPDGSQADQTRWRFSIYPVSIDQKFIDGLGYPEPEDMMIEINLIWILGYELNRIPRPIEISGNDSSLNESAPATEGVVVEEGCEVGGAVSQSVEALRESGSDNFDDEFIEVENSVDMSNLDSEKNDNVAVVSEIRQPLSLMTREEVERLIKKGKSWIYERLNRKHPRFDPTFPQPIEIGVTGVYFIETEIHSWWQTQIQNGIEKTRGTQPK